MELPATFVGFSGTDIKYYYLMKAWKKNENIDFDFRDCQLQSEIDSENEVYIKSLCRRRIMMASKFIMLIGEDTRYKYKYVRWETEVAKEKGCTIIGVNINGDRKINQETCPQVIRDIGAIFVSFSPVIIKLAIENYRMNTSSNYHYNDETYQKVGVK